MLTVITLKCLLSINFGGYFLNNVIFCECWLIWFKNAISLVTRQGKQYFCHYIKVEISFLILIPIIWCVKILTNAWFCLASTFTVFRAKTVPPQPWFYHDQTSILKGEGAEFGSYNTVWALYPSSCIYTMKCLINSDDVF